MHYQPCTWLITACQTVQVRNAASGIVQLTYGDDSLDPVSMEGKDGSPIDFVRTLSQIKAATPHDDAPGDLL